jgi:hypothetical protein
MVRNPGALYAISAGNPTPGIKTPIHPAWARTADSLMIIGDISFLFWTMCGIKRLSVNSHNFIEGNHGGGEIKQGAIGQIGLFIVEAFDNPSAGEEVRVAFRFGDFFPTRTNVRDRAARGDFGRFSDITRVKTKIFGGRLVVRTGYPFVQ